MDHDSEVWEKNALMQRSESTDLIAPMDRKSWLAALPLRAGFALRLRSLIRMGCEYDSTGSGCGHIFCTGDVV
jgi:hypothetical protein